MSKTNGIIFTSDVDCAEKRPAGVGADVSAGWSAKLELAFELRGRRTVLAAKHQRGPLTVQRPFYPEEGVCHMYLLHPPGGVVGGDSLEIDVHLRQQAHTLLTTPGAAKFYRSSGAEAVQNQRLCVDSGGVLEWFPRESILFPGARLRNHTRIELSDDALFIGWEIQSLGRPAIGERFASGHADFGFSVFRAGRPLLLERLRIRAETDLDGLGGLRGYPIGGTFVASGAGVQDLEAARERLGSTGETLCAMTLLEDLLVARCLARSVEPVHRIFLPLWGILRPRLVGRDACPPRIWAT